MKLLLTRLYTLSSKNKDSKSKARSLFLLLFLSSCFVNLTAQVLPGTANVAAPAGGFHIEGNLVANTPTANIGDWLPGTGGTGGNVLTAAGAAVNAATTFHLTDPYNASENNFSGGKKFNDNPNIWTWVNNTALAKCDINNALFHFATSNVGGVPHTWLIVAADRRSNSGAAYIDFELLQNTMTDNANGTFSSAGPNNGRTSGDVLLTLSLTNGGGTAEFFVNRWQAVASAAGGFDYVDRTSVTPAGSVFAATNAGTVPVSFPAFGINQYSANLFVEAAIDLTALLGAIDPCSSLGVKTLFIKTKTSPSPTATIVDFISAKQVSLQIGLANAGPSQTQCGNVFAVSGQATPSPGDAISSTNWSFVTGAGSIASASSAATNITVTTSPAIVRFTVNTNFGCVVSDTMILTVRSTPTVSVNSPSICAGSSATLTASSGASNPSYLWSPGGATTVSITVSPSSMTTYSVTVMDGTSGCSGSGSGTVSIKPTPGTPGVSVVNNCDGSSDLTATGFTGSLLWSNGAATTSIHVTNAATYTVTQTIDGCTSLAGSGTSAPRTTPAAPGVSVVNNCDGSSDLTATGFTGSLLWSNGATTTSIHVTNAATYTVTQTVNGCVSLAGSGTSAPRTTPAAPGVSVVNNCDGSSDLTATSFTGSLLWSNGATTTSIHVTNAATYTVTQTVNGCVSLSGSGTSAPRTTPAAPGVSVVNNCDGSSDLTATGFTGSLLWSNGAATTSIHVTNAATYTVTQTIDGCTSLAGSGTSAPRTTPAAPGVSVVNNCDGSSDLTATGFTGSLLWSNGATTTSIHVTNAATYNVTQTINGCTSLAGSGTSAPRTTPSAPGVNVVNNCDGSSDLTATGFTGSLLWSNGATTASIHVTNAATYTVTQTVNGCVSLAGSGTSAPRTTPAAPSVVYNAPACDAATFSVSVSSVISGATYNVYDKNGNSIGGVNPATPYVAPNNGNFAFGNIPAGSGYKVTATSNGCVSANNSCGVVLAARPIVAKEEKKTVSIPMGESTAKVAAFPNPFNDKVMFSLESPVSGKGTLELYNLTGQKIQTVFQGNIEKGKTRTIQYTVPVIERTSLVYIFRVGNYRTTGLLIGSR